MMEYMDYYASKVSVEQPYSFYVSGWDVEQTVFAYALDANGGQGGLGRLFVNPNAEEKGAIADLQALVDELNSATKTTSSVSIDAEPIYKKPVVTGKKLSNPETTMTTPSPKMMSQQKPSIRQGGLMQLDFVPAYWTK